MPPQGSSSRKGETHRGTDPFDPDMIVPAIPRRVKPSLRRIKPGFRPFGRTRPFLFADTQRPSFRKNVERKFHGIDRSDRTAVVAPKTPARQPRAQAQVRTSRTAPSKASPPTCLKHRVRAGDRRLLGALVRVLARRFGPALGKSGPMNGGGQARQGQHRRESGGSRASCASNRFRRLCVQERQPSMASGRPFPRVRFALSFS